MVLSSTFINIFKVIPKELFRLNYGCNVALREWTPNGKRCYDILTEAGMVKPKALNAATYRGASTKGSNTPKTNMQSSKWCFYASQHCIPE
jgi:hypothetical protein